MSKSLRAVGLAITLVSIVTFSTFAYSSIADFQGFYSSLQSGSSSALTGSAFAQGTMLLLDLNATVTNEGLFPLSITFSCLPMQTEGATCTTASATIPPGQTSTLVFRMAVPNETEYTSGAKQLHINGSVTLALEPFASVSITKDFGTFFVSRGS